MKQISLVCAGALVLLGLVSTPTFAQDNSPAGTWDVVLQTPQGANNVTLTIKVDGAKATGSLASAMGTMEITGSAKPDSVEMTGTMEIQGMSIPLTINATVAGASISGAMKFGDFGDAPLEGKRAAASTTAAAPAASAAPAAAMTGINGKWNVTLVLTGMGEFPLTASFTQTGQDVSGTLTSMLGEAPVKGTFVGSVLTLDYTADSPQGPIKITMTGELKDQTMTGKATIAGMGEAEWKAVR